MSTPNTPPFENPNTTNWRGAGAVPKFRYVYHESAETKGAPRQWSDTTAWLGVGVEDTVATSTRVAGVCPETYTAAGWGWIQSGGFCDYLVTDGDVVAPESNTLTGDVYIVAAASGGPAISKTAAEFNAMCTTSTDTAAYTSAFALNLAADADTTNIGTCIIVCAYQ